MVDSLVGPHLDWTLTSISSLFRSFFWKGLTISTHMFDAECDFNMIGRMSMSTATISESLGITENVRQTSPRRCYTCIHGNGRNV